MLWNCISRGNIRRDSLAEELVTLRKHAKGDEDPDTASRIPLYISLAVKAERVVFFAGQITSFCPR